MHKILVALVSTLILAACGGNDAPPADPYVAEALVDLEPGTELHVRGNQTGWMRIEGADAFNLHGPKLQRLDATENANEYTAFFRNNITGHEQFYGSATFLLPASGADVVVTGMTSENYEFRIIRINGLMTYTLTGLFDIDTAETTVANPNPGRQAHGGFSGGSDTPFADLPTTGTSLYAGSFIGRSSIGAIGEVTGVVALTVDWTNPATGVTGGITGISGGMNDFTIEAAITQNDSTGVNIAGYAGIVTAVAGGPFSGGETGVVDGGFYGPAAEETGGTIFIEQAGEYFTGAFGGPLD